MHYNKYIFIVFYFIIGFTSVSCCQAYNYDFIRGSIGIKVENKFGYKYYISGLDIDNSIDSSQVDGKIENPYKTLSGCYIFLAEGVIDSNLNKPEGFIGIYKVKLDSILWCSNFLTRSFSCAFGEVTKTGEINNDCKTEIIISQFKEPHGSIEQLWIFNWDGKEGNLITQLDEIGESSIKCEANYNLIDVDNDGIYEIQGTWTDKNGNSFERTFSWNGFFYGNWAKTSEYFNRGISK